MSDNTKTWPERIWLDRGENDSVYPGCDETVYWMDRNEPLSHTIEYVRADLMEPLLEALKWLMTASGEQLHSAFDAAQAAIANATGEK